MPPRRVPMIIGAILPVPHPENLVLTLAQAATLLNTSPEYVADLLTGREISGLTVEAVLAYRVARDEARHAGLRDLSRLSQEEGEPGA